MDKGKYLRAFRFHICLKQKKIIRFFFLFLLLFSLVMIFLSILFVVPAITTEIYEHTNSEWVNPHSWESNDDKLLQMQCSKVETCSANEMKMKNLEAAYKRLVYNIFDRSKFEVCTLYNNNNKH